MRAIISDIHGNKEALEAVLRSISALGVDDVWCLGDVIGYGPDPRTCLDLVRRNCSLCLMGNHDWAVLDAPVGFNSMATRMVYRTKEWLTVTADSTPEERERWEFLASLPLRSVQGGLLLVHASPRSELTEYILPSDVQYGPDKLEELFSLIDRHCFVGHTHIPCCIDESIDLIIPHGSSFSLELPDQKAIINIGSVGQPRDGDNRACYVSLDEGVVTYHRVPYPYDKTMEKIRSLGDEYEIMARRLAVGR